MTVSEARAALPEVLNRVESGEEVTITRHGRPVAVVIRCDIVWGDPRPQAPEHAAPVRARRRMAAGRRILEAEPAEVGDLLTELNELRGRRS